MTCNYATELSHRFSLELRPGTRSVGVPSSELYSQYILHLPRIPSAQELSRIPQRVSFARPGEALSRVAEREPLESLVLFAQCHLGIFGNEGGEGDAHLNGVARV